MPEPLFYIDVATQLDHIYTGIGNVGHQLVKWFRSSHPDDTVFFCQDQIVENAVIDDLLVRRNGVGLRDLFDRRLVTREPLASSLQRTRYRTTVAIFPSAKSARRVFDFEAQVIHDLSVQLMPEFHQASTIERHGTTVEEDLASDDLVICVSQNTFDDLALYLEVPPTKMMVAHLGVDDVGIVAPSDDVEPFILVLGTIEPRKNVELVLRTLRDRPDFLARWRFVFVGHEGWGPTFASLLASHGLGVHAGNRILHVGYVSDQARNALLANARCLVYPSFYEGFGLPVAEALHAGCAVITSKSSSLPEVGGPETLYVDPTAPVEMARALDLLTTATADALGSGDDQGRARRRTWASQFTWDRFCTNIHARICTDLARNASIPEKTSP